MSSMRNAVQRRNHKERAQPKQREKWGLLEKHKDYSLRAKDFNEKKKRLKILRQKAAERNPDEFHFAMLSSKTDSRGVKIADRGNAVLDPEAVLLLKTQDAGYLRTMAQKTRKAIERLEQALTLNKTEEGSFVVGKADCDNEDLETNHIAFVEDTEEQRVWAEQSMIKSTALADRLQEHPLSGNLDNDSDDDTNREQPQSKQALKKAEQEARMAKYVRRRRKRDHEVRDMALRILRKREKSLRAAENQLEIQRSQMSGGHGIGVTKKGVSFKNKVRKR